ICVSKRNPRPARCTSVAFQFSSPYLTALALRRVSDSIFRIWSAVGLLRWRQHHSNHHQRVPSDSRSSKFAP
ncbi:hypothetical protein SCHPADRAFT_1003477, partial [Schizopora paradoxa]